ncbi:hypothetical protein HNQ96_004476 [Aminobacter lissarensis]|uniref:Uncharacterized protein n=1 Tax=Aminobacter carboxidus TaxID=376165 RepID=A0A8E2BFC0_9HYPH|nr:hypothetical protein [Aminobacter lissarensis]MBB6468592.1 hypothetical protein [Aminobacter lissarensis]
MADSDNTTALPFVIPEGRRMSCAVDDDTRAFGGRAADGLKKRLFAPIDPCVVLLQDWEHAHHMAVVLCRLQQRLEIRIRNALAVASPDGEADGPSSTTTGDAATPADQQARWDALDQKVGYSRARAAETQAVEAEEEILKAVSATPAQSIAGVIAKLTIIAGGGESMGDSSAFPWPQIQSALADVKGLSEREAVRLRASTPDGETTSGSNQRQS